MTPLDPTACYRALQTRDPRFDGRLFVGVVSTGVYCRPVCPAGTPKPENCRFYATAAAAAEDGFRPCLRCRPEAAPDTGPWNGTITSVRRALALIDAGALDGADGSVDALAGRLGLGERQLRRLFREHLGASPIAVAQTRRVHFAKQLIHETRLPMTEIAHAAGFGSIRRFNELFLRMFGRPPSALRRTRSGELPASDGVRIRLAWRPPYDHPAILGFLAARAIDGVERVTADAYARTVRIDGVPGSVAVRVRGDGLDVAVRVADVRALSAIVRNIRRVFDLSADVEAIGAWLARDPLLAPRVAARPGLRTPGGWDGFEVGVRAILGQQVSVEAARRLVSRLVALCGSPIPPDWAAPGLDRCFPTADQVAACDLDPLPVPGSRRRAVAALARAALADPELFAPGAGIEATVARLCQVPGIGPWSAQVIALRAVREPDAFPASDVGLLRAAAIDGVRPSADGLAARAEAWRPWRAYAAQHLWTADAADGGPR